MKGSLRTMMAIASLGLIAAPVTASGTGTNIQHERKAVNQKFHAPVKQAQALNMMQSNSRGSASGAFKNQRQYRKHIRQNPHLLKSKKHRSKN